jgi:DNA-binding CsgD family transcriptional regulator
MLREKLLAFSDREFRIMQYIHAGLTNAEIALSLGKSEHMVKNYLRVIYDKAGKNTRLELALWMEAVESGECEAPKARRAKLTHRERNRRIADWRRQYRRAEDMIAQALKAQETAARQLRFLGVRDPGIGMSAAEAVRNTTSFKCWEKESRTNDKEHVGRNRCAARGRTGSRARTDFHLIEQPTGTAARQ